jgi:hypothetical protein
MDTTTTDHTKEDTMEQECRYVAWWTEADNHAEGDEFDPEKFEYGEEVVADIEAGIRLSGDRDLYGEPRVREEERDEHGRWIWVQDIK